MSQNISELNLAPISDEKLVDFINQQLPITVPALKDHIIEEFKRRGLDYRHLYNVKTDELNIKLPLSLIDGCLFERNIPKPPLVGNFYAVVHRLRNFLQHSKELNGKRLKTFHYIFDQLYLPYELIDIISEDDVKNLTEDDVFITFKNSKQHFPNDKIINKIPKNNLLITVDKGNYYRGLDKVILSHQNTIIKEENLNNVTA
ncbi:hypothetical protein HXZ62_08685 [Empedobacter falsenii]|uniref:Uncharacterized protein n=1 Tax=Empedobacter tilapiae TaxID=2491114 RepID=A0A4Z1BI00_9FLAO|nr:MULTISPECIES: hypothetical protein [Empedobacter]MDM1062637.1 hypothetical protein [Empedobacter falsenii]TGN24609.1 hypothetical protein E4J94_13260 [Empedobacter tilapiae]HCC94019.1 hypothetical protein [Flavobacteriaceae bacterium]